MINPNEIAKLMQNPIGYAMSKGFNLPPNVNFQSPKDIVMYLVNSGQASQDALNQGQQFASQYGYKL